MELEHRGGLNEEIDALDAHVLASAAAALPAFKTVAASRYSSVRALFAALSEYVDQS